MCLLQNLNQIESNKPLTKTKMIDIPLSKRVVQQLCHTEEDYQEDCIRWQDSALGSLLSYKTAVPNTVSPKSPISCSTSLGCPKTPRLLSKSLDTPAKETHRYNTGNKSKLLTFISGVSLPESCVW